MNINCITFNIWRWLFFLYYCSSHSCSSSWHILTNSAETEIQWKLLNTEVHVSQKLWSIVKILSQPFQDKFRKSHPAKTTTTCTQSVNTDWIYSPGTFFFLPCIHSFFTFTCVLWILHTFACLNQPPNTTFTLFWSKTIYFFNTLNIPKALFKSFGS